MQRKLEKNNKMLSLVIFIFIYFSNESLFFGALDNVGLFVVKYAVLGMVLIGEMLFLKKNKPKFTKNYFYAFIIISIILVFSELLSGNIGLSFLIKIFLVFIGFIFVNNHHMDDYIKIFIKIVVVLSCISLFIYFLELFFHQLIVRFPMVTNKVGSGFYNVFFLGFVPKYVNYSYGIRNYGIFREPGVFACYIAIALLLIIISSRKLDKKTIFRIFILNITMLTTFSTAGIITQILIMLLLPLIKTGIKYKRISFSIIVIILIGYSMGLFDAAFSKFDESSIYYGSASSRYNIIIIDFHLFLQNPLLGIGMNNYNDNFKNVNLVINNNTIQSNHDTNTFLKVLAQSGIFYLWFTIVGIYAFFKKISDNKKISFLSIIILAVILSNEDLSLNIILFIMMFYGLNQKCQCVGGDFNEATLDSKYNFSISR